MSVVNPHTHNSWELWLEELSKPLSGLACGEDLKYEETFKALKASSSGVGEVDFKVMFIQATDLLQNQSKDLRIVSYLCLAATSEFGVVGLTHSLKLFNQLLSQFSEQVHPLKARMRCAVNTWFLQQQERLKGIAQAQSSSPEQWAELETVLAEYNQVSVPVLDAESGPLSTLNEWVKEQVIRNPVAKPEPEVKSEPKAQETIVVSEPTTEPVAQQVVQAKPVTTAPKVADIASDSAYLAAIRELLNFDKEQNNIERVLKLSRAARWSGLALPANENGKTRLPAPRAAAFAPIENALATEQAEQALLLAEGLFMEGAMQFNLNLQMLTLSALKQLNKAKLVQWLEQQLVTLVSQFPLLTNLKYDDGSGLCSPQNKEALLDIANSYASQNETTQVQANPFDEHYIALSEQVAKGQLSAALSLVAQLSTPTGFDQAQSQLLKAKLLLKAEHYEHALAILTELLEQIETYQLAKWQQQFCMEVWRFAKQCYANLSQTESDDMSLAAKQISQRMMVTNPAQAIAWV